MKGFRFRGSGFRRSDSLLVRETLPDRASEAVKHRRNFFRFRYKTIRITLFYEVELARNVELSAQLTARSFRDV
jgi:hypothetical protein